MQEIGYINNGESSINELTSYLGKLLGVEIKDILCYNTYANIKHRKNKSRTYFLDKMRERLNLRMQRNDAKELARRQVLRINGRTRGVLPFICVHLRINH